MATIGVVHFHFNGLDGVTLQARVVADVLERNGHSMLWYGGHFGDDFRPAVFDPYARHDSGANRDLSARLFGPSSSQHDLAQTKRVLAETTLLLEESLRHLARACDVLFVHNVLALPMNVPFAMALANILRETGIPAIAHNHDFVWERSRFDDSVIAELIADTFPPKLDNLEHFVINEAARRDLALHRGVDAIDVLPNVLDFAKGWHRQPDGDRFRRLAGIESGAVLFLQPTRTVPRKNIERSIDLAVDTRLDFGGRDVVLVVTHEIGDEGFEYVDQLRAKASALGVDLRFVPVASESTHNEVADLGDAYAAADLVTYFSTKEGFGNAAVESMFFRAPLVVNRYEQWVQDIAPTGVDVLETGPGPLTNDEIARIQTVIDDRGSWQSRAEKNYEIGRTRFSYETIESLIVPVIDRMLSGESGS